MTERLALAFLLNAAWQTALVALAALLADRLLKNGPARFRHRLWVLALVLGLALPLLTTMSVSLWPAAEPAYQTPTSGPPPVSHTRTVPVSLPGRVDLLILAGYASFPLYRMVCLALAWRRTAAIGRAAYARPLPVAAAELLARCETAFGLRGVTVLASAEVAGPLAMGFWRPMIVLPESLLEDAPADVLATALGHEMAHVRRRDFACNLVYELLCLPIAFHAAAGLMRRRIAETRELACDEMVTERLVSPRSYAESLVQLARRMTPEPEPVCTLGVFDAGILEQRVVRLLRRRVGASVARWPAVLGATLLALSAMVASGWSLAPAGTASLSGRVYDASGGAIPGARVSLTQIATGVRQRGVTGPAGDYSLQAAWPGLYELRVESPGFKRYRQRIMIGARAAVRADVTLDIGIIRESITVHGTP